MNRRIKNGFLFFALLVLGLGILVFHSVRFHYYSLSSADIKSIDSGSLIAMGHGGMGTRSLIYSMNSRPSIKKSFTHGATGVEIDVQITKDGKLILFHDKYLPGSEDDKNMIRNRDWIGDLENLKFPASLFKRSKILTLDAFFELDFLLPKTVISIDHKMYASTNAIADQESITAFSDHLIPILEKQQNIFHLMVESRYPDLLKAIQSSTSAVQLFYNSPSFNEGLKISEENCLTGISIFIDLISEENIKLARSKRLKVCVYGANTWPKNKKALLMGPDYIQSDRIRHLVKIREDLYE